MTPPRFSRRDATAGLTGLLLSTPAHRAIAQRAGDSGTPYPIQAFGYVGDGHHHPLSSIPRVGTRDTRGWTLEKWRTLFPRAASLAEEIDRHAIQAFCDAHPEGVALDLPAGIAMIDRGLVTGGSQHVHLRGAGRDLTEMWFFEAGGTFWGHGLTHPADGTWTVEDLTIRPKAICAAVFEVRFSGRQPAWCHILRNVQFVPADAINYFETACITANIKRGLDWQNVVAYGWHFHKLSSNAFEFPPNVDQSSAGTSYNFNNVMTVGYAYAIHFDFTGFTSTTSHMHEEAQLYNVQAYAGTGLLKARNGNYGFAPADNFTLAACGWQGTGPALDLAYLEHVRVRDTLFVTDAGAAPGVAIATLMDCDSVMIEDNEFFAPAGKGMTGIDVSGSRTRNLVVERTDVVAYAAFETFLRIAKEVPPEGVEERATRFAGTATYRSGKVEDLSGHAISETRAVDRASSPSATPPIPGSQSVSVNTDGDIVWDAIVSAPMTASGDVEILFPPDLFRSIKSVSAEAAGGISSWANVAAFDAKGATIRYPAGKPADAANIRTHVRAIGR